MENPQAEVQAPITNFAEAFAQRKKELAFPDSKKVNMIEEVLGKEIIVKDFKVFPSAFAKQDEDKSFAVVNAELNGEMVSFNAGEVVAKQLEAIKDKLPVKAVVKKVKRYYTLS